MLLISGKNLHNTRKHNSWKNNKINCFLKLDFLLWSTTLIRGKRPTVGLANTLTKYISCSKLLSWTDKQFLWFYNKKKKQPNNKVKNFNRHFLREHWTSTSSMIRYSMSLIVRRTRMKTMCTAILTRWTEWKLTCQTEFMQRSWAMKALTYLWSGFKGGNMVAPKDLNKNVVQWVHVHQPQPRQLFIAQKSIGNRTNEQAMAGPHNKIRFSNKNNWVNGLHNATGDSKSNLIKRSRTQKMKNYVTPFMCNYQKIKKWKQTHVSSYPEWSERRDWL